MKQLVSKESQGAGRKSRRSLVANPELVTLCAKGDPGRQATRPTKSIGSVYGQG